MADRSKIEWTEATWNPVTGCDKVSQGCKNCYAERFAERWRGIPGHHFEQGFDVRLFPERLAIPLQWKRPRRIFVNSMSDLFHEKVPDEFIAQVFATMRTASQHTFQVLTKRPERMAAWREWPRNVWMGVSIESQDVASRADYLDKIQARVRFVSAEPLLGPLNLRPWLNTRIVNWVIAGGESGPEARPMDPIWASDLIVQCAQVEVPFFMKQLGGRINKRGAMSDFPPYLRTRNFPNIEGGAHD